MNAPHVLKRHLRKHPALGVARWAMLVALSALPLIACSGGSSSSSTTADDSGQALPPPPPPPPNIDTQLRQIINARHITGDAAANRNLPHINEPLPRLGLKLFFSESLGGGKDAACASCHHPVLGGADGLSLPVGVAAAKPDLVGPGRQRRDGTPLVPRNSPTVFNAGLSDAGMFWDMRVESLGKEAFVNGAFSGIRTPDTPFGVADPMAGTTLTAAQARFPVTVAEEMRTASFEPGGSNDAVRQHLAARLGNYGKGVGELGQNNWLKEFQLGFGSALGPKALITYQNIALAIAEYERSMTFTNNAWKHYVAGDTAALTADQKAGALLFLTPGNQGGAGCVACHSGESFSDSDFHTVAFPLIGPGKGDDNADDFGRERETHNPADRYSFRTPGLLNIEMSAPYGHTGVYRSLEDVIRHYINPQASVNNFFNNGGWCQLPQFHDLANCAQLYPNAAANSQLALQKLQFERQSGLSKLEQIRLSPVQVTQLASFLRALTDPCVKSRSCLTPWIPLAGTKGPDGLQLNAVDRNGQAL